MGKHMKQNIDVSKPEVDRVGKFSWVGRQQIIFLGRDGKPIRTVVYDVHARTKSGAYRKLVKRQQAELYLRRSGRYQSQKAGDNAVQTQIGSVVGSRFDPTDLPYDPALDWSDRYPDER